MCDAYVLFVEVKVDCGEVCANISHYDLTLDLSQVAVHIITALLDHDVTVSVKQSLTLSLSSRLKLIPLGVQGLQPRLDLLREKISQ